MLDALDMLFADRKIGAASKLAFLQLWRFARGQPGHVVITADWLAGRCGRSPRSAWDWLDDLEKHDLIKIGERNERRGSVEVFVYSPAPGSSADREAIPDPQLKLDLQSTDREAIPDRKAIMQRDAGGETAGGFSTKTPDQFRRRLGGFRAEIPAPFGTKEKQRSILPKHQRIQRYKALQRYHGDRRRIFNGRCVSRDFVCGRGRTGRRQRPDKNEDPFGLRRCLGLGLRLGGQPGRIPRCTRRGPATHSMRRASHARGWIAPERRIVFSLQGAAACRATRQTVAATRRPATIGNTDE